MAQNEYGESSYSISGSGAVMMLVPDAPYNLKNEVTVTSADTIKFTWKTGLSNGGSPVTGYSVLLDTSGNDNYEVVQA